MFSAFARQFVSMFIRAFLGTARYGRIPEHPRGYLRATGYGLGGHGRIPRVQGTVCVCVRASSDPLSLSESLLLLHSNRADRGLLQSCPGNPSKQSLQPARLQPPQYLMQLLHNGTSHSQHWSSISPVQSHSSAFACFNAACKRCTSNAACRSAAC